MTTLQPRLVRADTLDLQSHDAPSAQDHTRSPTFTPYAHGQGGSHHREALRNAEEAAYNDRRSSPRVSMDESNPSHGSHLNPYDSPDEEEDEEQQDRVNGSGLNESEFDDGNDEADDDLDDDMMDKISSSPSIEDEDIDFEFVYALHTFVATVEGQANATKGDTMVLLDDSNSYWWLVRVVKDGSIGYLPAEHIETPTERLARLNKHRNIDLSASMLGDNPVASKNPIKKAMRRRNAKSVAFAPPTYYEPSDYEYDTDEEEADEADHIAQQARQAQDSQTTLVEQDPAATHDPDAVATNGIKKVASDDQLSTNSQTSPTKANGPGLVTGQSQSDENLQRSRNGVVRNTDSFFKDDSVETKKISLTPRLLRNDTDSANSGDPELRSKNSADTFEKMLSGEEKPKEKEKKKEKKGVFGGLFKKKDKSAKGGKAEVEDEKADTIARHTRGKESIDSISGGQSPERKPSKLQKQPPNSALKNSPTESNSASKDTSSNTSPALSNQTSNSPALSSESKETNQVVQTTARNTTQTSQTPHRFPSLTEKRSIFAPITTVLKSSPSNDHEPVVKPVYSKRAKERFAIDVSDSEDDHTPTMSIKSSQNHRSISPMHDTHMEDSRPDSAMEVSPVEPPEQDLQIQALQNADRTVHEIVTEPEPLSSNTQEVLRSDTASTSKPSPSLATHTPSTSRSTPTWSDASLRSYMDNDQDIRDLLIIVHDKSNVTPVGPEHPLMGGLFMTERTRLAEMQTQLDSMLTTWISKKSPSVSVK